MGEPVHRFEIYWYLVQINIIWGLVNLLPVWPLDGGRVSEIVLSYINPARADAGATSSRSSSRACSRS